MARAALDITTADLAKMASVGVNTVNRFERGEAVRAATITRVELALASTGRLRLISNPNEDVVALLKS